MVMVQSAPDANEPRVQVTALPTLEQLPGAPEVPVTVNWEGTVSDTDRLLAAEGPALWTVRV
jgi:hypothetical protein